MHECTKYHQVNVASDWTPQDNHLVRYITPTPQCVECEAPKPTNQGIRPYKFLDRKTARPHLLAHLPHTQTLARAVMARMGKDRDWIPWPGLESELLNKNRNPSIWRHHLDEFLEAGWIATRSRRVESWHEVEAIQVLDNDTIIECAEPGMRKARLDARDQAHAALQGHGPAAQVARTFLAGKEWLSWPPEALALVTVVANHADSGRRLRTRVLSGTAADDTKVLEAHQGRLERIFGKFEELGLYGHSALDLIGGQGSIQFPHGRLDVTLLQPYGAVTVQQLRHTVALDPGPGGIWFIENKTVFEAACSHEVDVPDDALMVFTGGQPSLGVQHAAQLAAALACPVRIWCDLDPAGVQIARLIHGLVGPRAQAMHMSAQEYLGAANQRPIKGKNLQTLNDLTEEGFLGDLVVAMKASKHWVEHETQLLMGARAGAPRETPVVASLSVSN